MVTNWADITIKGLEKFWEGLVAYIPTLIIAIIIFIIGWFIAIGIGKLTEEILKRLKFDRLFAAEGWKEALEKADFKIGPSEFIGDIVKWILIIVFLAVSVEILGLQQFSSFLDQVVMWLPNLLAAVLIFIATVVIARFAEKLVEVPLRKSKVEYAKLAGSITRWAVWVFGLFAILLQLGIAKELIIALFWGIVGLITIAGGIAFGLGGRDLARDILDDLRHRVKK